jgi:hypothetical protein
MAEEKKTSSTDLDAKNKPILWKKKPGEHDYPAAFSYLRLIMSDSDAKCIVERLKSAEMSTAKAKDIIRASGVRLLDMDDPGVKRDLAKISQGEKLSPVLLVHFNGGLVIADGYHRCCAVYHYDYNMDVPMKIG